MNKDEKFLKYLKETYDCSSVYEYVDKVIGDLDNNVIDDIVPIMDFIQNNFGKSCLNHFMFEFKGVLIKRNSKKAEKMQNSLIDSDVEYKCFMRSEEESVIDDYSGYIYDDPIENGVKRR